MLIQRLQGDIEKKQGIYYEFDVHSKPLGVGGMGKVYLGSKVVEESGKRTPVAIKAMYEGLPEHIIERARRESSIQIKHENLVEMMGFVEKNDISSTGGNVIHYHVISEYINGVSLYDILHGETKNQFGVELESAQKLYSEYTKDKLKVSLIIIKQVLSAIMSLHDNGYIHRDIDPSNVMVTSTGAIKLIDFGIAKRIDTLGTQDKMLTATGVFMGKAQYAAPELVTGDVNHQDVTTDIYSIGILFYQLLVGDLPFDGPISEILDAQLHKKMPVNNISDKDCRMIVKKATEKKQAERYHSSAEFRVAIDSLKSASNQTTPNPKRKVLLMVASVLLPILFVVYYFVKDYIIQEEKNPPIVVRQEKENSQNGVVVQNIEPTTNTISQKENVAPKKENSQNGVVVQNIEPTTNTISQKENVAPKKENSQKGVVVQNIEPTTNTISQKENVTPKKEIINSQGNKPKQKSVITIAINSDITSIYSIGAFNYKELESIAEKYSLGKDVNREYEYYGKELINSNKGCNIRNEYSIDDSYSNSKVAFILYSELKFIATNNEDKQLEEKSDKQLKMLRKKLGY